AAPTRRLSDIAVGGSLFLKATTSGWRDLGQFQIFQINWEHVQPIPQIQGTTGSRFLVIPEGPSSFPSQSAEAPVQPFASLDTLQKRYKELNSKSYLGQLTPPEKLELEKVEQQLDEIDARDADLTAFTQQIKDGYNKLHRGLTEINRILDELLTD